MPISVNTLNTYANQIASGTPGAEAAYYAYLASNGIPYGMLAGDVAAQQNFMGEITNGYLKHYIKSIYPEYTDAQASSVRDAIMQDLALRDIAARNTDLGLGGDGNINYRTISNYHYASMADHGLPPTAWSGALFEEFLGDGSWMNGYDSNIIITVLDYFNLGQKISENASSNAGFSAQDAYVALLLHGLASGVLADAVSHDANGAYGAVGTALNFLPDGMNPVAGALAALDFGVAGFAFDYTGLGDDLSNLYQQAYDLVTPIALDLNGDGIHYTALTDSKVYFDIDADQFSEHVEWLDGNDGFLVRDLNGNGQIDNVAEMFGESGGTSAYAQLAALDTNTNGKLDSGDAAFSSLKIWQDANTNGRVDAGELTTLSARNIASISTVVTSDTISGGHAVAGTSTFTYVNGTIGNAADVMLETNQLDSWYVGGAGGPAINLSTLFLPQSRGYGTLPTLAYAMTMDSTLETLVTNFTNLTSSQMECIR